MNGILTTPKQQTGDKRQALLRRSQGIDTAMGSVAKRLQVSLTFKVFLAQQA